MHQRSHIPLRDIVSGAKARENAWLNVEAKEGAEKLVLSEGHGFSRAVNAIESIRL